MGHPASGAASMPLSESMSRHTGDRLEKLPALGGEGVEGFAGDLHTLPLDLHDGSHLLVEVDGGGVPVEDVPLEARAAFGYGDGGEAGEEGFADSLPAVLGADVEVFEVDAGVAAPGGVVVEVEGEACGFVASIAVRR